MLLQQIFKISFLLSYLTSDKLTGMDGINGSKICVNCFVLNRLCSMWSSTDWFPLFKQYSSYMKGHCTYLWLVPLHYGDISEEVDTSPPTYCCTWAGRTAWMKVRDLCQEETIYKCCRHNPMAQTGLTCTASFWAPQSVSTPPPPPPPPHPAPTLSCTPPAWEVSTPPRAGRLTGKVQPFSVVYAFT